MDYFEYRGSAMYCEEVSLRELCMQYGTPLYVYSHRTLSRHFKVFDEALSEISHIICYAAKANSNLAILSAISKLGGGADVVSGGEFFKCLKAGISPSKIVFSGVGKTIQELEYVLRNRILLLSVESSSELQQISAVAKKFGTKAPISLRLNPDVNPNTHPYISTGLKKNKFGLTQDVLMSLFEAAKKDPHLDPIGLNVHIGSQITETSPFVEAVTIACDVIRKLRKQGIAIQYLDCGGGLGVRYREESPPSPSDYASCLIPLIKDLDLTLLIEPGRALVANAGILLTKVIYVKKTLEKTFVIVDAGMNDLIRPALYGAQHEIEPVHRNFRPHSRHTMKADIVGPICESSDFLAKDREMEEVFEGDLLCIRTAGAYGFAMASQYNSRPRPPEVLVRDDQSYVVRQRESFDDLIRGEKIPDWLQGNV